MRIRSLRALVRWGLCAGVVLAGAGSPGQGRAAEDAAQLLGLPLVSLEEQAAPVGLPCVSAPQRAPLAIPQAHDRDPASKACIPTLGFSTDDAPVNFLAAGRLGWFRALGRFWYLSAGIPAVFALGGGGGGGGGSGGGPTASGGPGDAEPELPRRSDERPYQNPIPEPTSVALFVAGAALVGGALRRRRL